MASYLLSTVSKYYRLHAQVGPGLEVGGKKMPFLIELPENRSFTLSNTLHTRGFVTVFLVDSLKTLFTHSVCFHSAVLGPIFRSLFSMVDSGSEASCDKLLDRLHVWREGKQKQPRGGPGAGSKHLALGVSSSLGEAWRQWPRFPLQIGI